MPVLLFPYKCRNKGLVDSTGYLLTIRNHLLSKDVDCAVDLLSNDEDFGIDNDAH